MSLYTKTPQEVHRNLLLIGSEPFRENKKGIPEWLKNADDSCNRIEDSESKDFSGIPIIINFTKDAFYCLDFGGADGDKLIKYFLSYGNPDAAKQGEKLIKHSVSGGHGNGGKYYGMKGFEVCEIINYCKGKLTTMKIDINSDYIGDRNIIYDALRSIKKIGFDCWKYFDNDPEKLIEKIKNGKLGFFCWKGSMPKDVRFMKNKKSMLELIDDISNNTQSKNVLKNRRVDILFNGELFYKNLKSNAIEIDPKYPIREFIIPLNIGGYNFNKKGNSKLKISISKELLIGNKSSLNILEILSNNKNIAWYYIGNLTLDKSLSKFIYAEVDAEELKEDYNCVTNERDFLVKNEISELFLKWCTECIEIVLNNLKEKEQQKKDEENLREISSFFENALQDISDLLQEEIKKDQFDINGIKVIQTEAPAVKEGFGSEGKIKNPGGGKRLGGLEPREDKVSEKRTKSQIKVLISGIDTDPLNPGLTRNMISREPILDQRTQDIEYGIWWVNSSKEYLKNIDVKDPKSRAFYYSLVKEIVLSHRIRRMQKNGEEISPDNVDTLNFKLIDEIFLRISDKLLGEIKKISLTISERIKDCISNKNDFTIQEISEELDINPINVHVFINQNKETFEKEFTINKGKIEGSNRLINIYTRKIPLLISE